MSVSGVNSHQALGLAQIALLKKTLDFAMETGVQTLEGMQKGMEPHLGQNVDITV